MKILLIGLNARYSHSALSLYYLRQSLEENNIKSFNLQLSINMPLEKIKKQLLKIIQNHKIKNIGFSTYIWNRQEVELLSEFIKKQQKDSVIIWGGPEVGANQSLAERTLKKSNFVDYIVIGEGEKTLPNLIKKLYLVKNKKNKINLPGIAGFDENNTIYSTTNNYLKPEEWPFPYVITDEKDLKHKIIYYETSRGCPFRCSFCISAGEKLRVKNMAQIEADILKLLKFKDAVNIKFIDRTFNYNPQRAEAIIALLLKHYRKGLTWHMELAPDLLTESLINILNKAPKGYLQVEIGVQSCNEKALSAINRKTNWEKNKKALKEIRKKNNINIHLDLIAGLPYDNWESVKKSFNDTVVLAPNDLQLGFLKVLPGSVLEKQAKYFKLNYAKEPPYQIISTPDLSKLELENLEEIACLLDAYYNQGTFFYTLNWLNLNWPKSAFDFYNSFNYWFKNIKKQKKIPLSGNLKPRRNLLKEFLVESFIDKKDIWNELLIMDDFAFRYGEDKNKNIFYGIDVKDYNNIKKIVIKNIPDLAQISYTKWYKKAGLRYFENKIYIDNKLRVKIVKSKSLYLFDFSKQNKVFLLDYK